MNEPTNTLSMTIAALAVLLLLGAGFGCDNTATIAAAPEAEAPSARTQRTPTAEQLAAVTYGEYTEAPMLKALVALGDLPPVEQRLPDEPKVVEPVESIGRYGGELRVLATSRGPYNDMQGLSGANLFRIPRSGVGIEPDLAEGYAISNDDEVFTIRLRRGLRWSDGEPFTAEDIRFMYEDLIPNQSLRIGNAFPQIQTVRVIDDYTVELVSSPYKLGNLAYRMAEWLGGQAQSFQPAHYLKKWHAKYNPDADQDAKKAGHRDWIEAISDSVSWDLDADLPVLRPWIIEKRAVTAKRHVRNPYFWRVDQEGRQLPYIDAVSVRILGDNPFDQSAYLMEETSEKIDIVYSHTDFSRLEFYRLNSEKGNYRIVLFPGGMSSTYTFTVFQNHRDEGIRSVLNSLEFRQALSSAIDRVEINKVFYSDIGVPGQASPLPSSSFSREEWGSYEAQYDREKANRLLDSLGLTERDSEGFRKGRDGKTFLVVLMYSETHMPGILELIKEYWQAVGIKTLIKQQEPGIFNERIRMKEVTVSLNSSRNFPPSSEREILMNLRLWSLNVAPDWDEWASAKYRAVEKAQGDAALADWWSIITVEDGDLPGEKPPTAWLENWGRQERWSSMDFGTPEYRETAWEIFDFWVGNLYHIGTVGQIPKIMLVKHGLGNVIPPGWVGGMPLDNEIMGQWYDQLFWKTEG